MMCIPYKFKALEDQNEKHLEWHNCLGIASSLRQNQNLSSRRLNYEEAKNIILDLAFF
jgi:hypothetical protein